MKEIWKQYKDSNYEVSNMGQVRNKTTEVVLKQQKKDGKENGYRRLSMYIDGKQIKKSVHRLVAETFIDNPQGLPQVNHKNSQKGDNRVENLEWCTNDYNLMYSYEKGERYYLPRVPVILIKDETNKEFESKYAAAKWLKNENGCAQTIKYISKKIDQALKHKCRVFGYYVNLTK